MDKPKTIHDCGGFPRELFEFQYPAPGSVELAYLTPETVRGAPVKVDQAWGLDHGTWSVLGRMFPEANVPVVQLSLDRSQQPDYHYALGKELPALRHKGVLIVGSGTSCTICAPPYGARRPTLGRSSLTLRSNGFALDALAADSVITVCRTTDGVREQNADR